ncbi:MAG: thiol-disulfide isomerase/thioredoxin [Paraglaciecola sp.]|jgi:thiol-disulfide isomerase/thioredoxin
MPFIIGPLALPVTPILLLGSLMVGLLVAGIVGKKQNISVSDPLLTIFFISLLVGRAVFVWRFMETYQSVWQVLDIRDRGFDLSSSILTGTFLLIAQLKRKPEQRLVLISAAVTTTLLFIISLSVFNTGRHQGVMPDLVLAQLNGQKINIKQISEDKITVVNLWATWCPPCRREMPVFADAQKRNPHVRFIMLNQGESARTIKQFLQRIKQQFVYIMLDKNGDMATIMNAHGLPMTLYYDQDSNLVDSHFGEVSAATLQSAIQSLEKP